MPKGAVAEYVERSSPRQRLRTLRFQALRAVSWWIWDQRWLVGATLPVVLLVPAYVLGPLVPVGRVNLTGITILALLAAVAWTPLGRELRAMGRRRHAGRVLWNEWIDFCEDADCAKGPSGNRRAPYLLRRPRVKGATLSIDVQRIHGTTDAQLEVLVEQIARYFRGHSPATREVDGPIPSTARLRFVMDPRAPAEAAEAEPGWPAA